MSTKRPFWKPATNPDRGRVRQVFNGAVPGLAGSAASPAGAAAAHDLEIPLPPASPLLAHDTLGAALRAVRIDLGRTLQDIADDTRVRRVYLEAIEDMRLEALPSRPFAIGYIRAFASSLGLDPNLAIERFKTDDPVLDEPLQAPVGMPDDRDPRVAAFLIGALVIISAIVLWNVAQRAMTANAPPSSLTPKAATAKALANVRTGVVELGAPLPAPVESTTPPAYETPGLAASMGLKTDLPATDAAAPASSVDVAALPQVFTPQGKIYDAGSPQQVSNVILQALKPASLIIRGTDGSVYFARQLARGEAFRVPQVPGLTLEVSKADDVQVFVSGRSRGVLPAQQVLASKLAGPPSIPVRPGA